MFTSKTRREGEPCPLATSLHQKNEIERKKAATPVVPAVLLFLCCRPCMVGPVSKR